MGKEEGLCADKKSGDIFQKSPGALLTFWKGLESMNKDGGLGRLCSLESEICSQCLALEMAHRVKGPRAGRTV